MSEDLPRFAAVIGHADEPEMLEACIRHHLSVGVGRLFVSLNNATPEAAEALQGDERVRVVSAIAFAQADSFQYFSHALRGLMDWAAPEWVLFTDSDELWLPESGKLSATRGLSDSDLLIVERYNTVPLRLRNGEIVPPDLADPYAQPLVLAREPIDEQYLAGDYRIPWIMGADAPKLLVRPDLVQQVGAGGHSIQAIAAGLRWTMPDDLIILHAPFTTEQRFRRKAAAVRDIMASHAGRFNARQAWHWRYWAGLAEDRIAAEFQRQCIAASAAPLLRRQAVIGNAADLYPQLRQRADELAGDALHEFLGRAILGYQRS